jgi:hypothetical protein
MCGQHADKISKKQREGKSNAEGRCGMKTTNQKKKERAKYET